MKKNIVITVGIMMLFAIVFIIGNGHYFKKSNAPIVKQGVAIVTSEQLENNKMIKLNGEWFFYPNVLLSPQQLLNGYTNQPILLKVPDKWAGDFQLDEEGPIIGTYHLKVKVPVEDQYGLFFWGIHKSNRVFINGIEVGGKGNPDTSFAEFRSENDDKFMVIGQSEEQVLDILIQVASFKEFPNSGIVESVEFGTRDTIQHFYDRKRLTDILAIAGYIVFGIIYLISYGQNRKRKEELFFGLFMILMGFHASFISMKIFFQIVPIGLTTNQLQFQLGIIPLLNICMVLFLYTMYPQMTSKKVVYTLVSFLSFIFFIYGIYNPFSSDISEMTKRTQVIQQITYLLLIIPGIGYIALILIRIILRNLEGASYVLIVFMATCCYSILMIVYILTEISVDYSGLVLFLCILVGFSLLLNYRTNATFTKQEALTEELQIHNHMKDEFLLKTSHELRTPLNGILNLSKLLMEGAEGSLKRNQQEQVILIHNITQRLGEIVEDLLFSSNHNISGELRVSPRVVPVSIINDVVTEIRSVMSANSYVRLLVEVDMTLSPMLTDELRFKQVLYNLLHNALQHTELGEVIVTAYQRQQHMVIEVSDTGKGIPAQDLEHIFTAFYRVKNEHYQEGLGLGLSIAKNIVDKLNGTIDVKSTLGEGTTFTFTMPLATKSQIDSEASPVTTEQMPSAILQLELPLIHQGNDKKILVVDDEHFNIKVLTDALALKGYTVIGVDNGFAAIDYIKINQVDCMLVDLMMEGMSGYELCKQVRKQYDMLELPIIVLTAIMKHSDFMLTLQLGANDYLQKPIAMDELLLRIESLLAVRQSSLDAIEVEMNNLYSQVTPHFVYNTLTTIIGLSYTDMENAREALYCLTTYFRAKLNVHSRNNMILLEEEIELVKAYLAIEKMRFGERLTIKYNIDESIQLMIPALSLQPLVENAVFHGISKKSEGGTIEVSVQREGQFVQIKIYDNGVGIPAKKLQQLMNEESPRIGFTNPLKKFRLMKNVSLRLYSKEGKGTTILILLPEGDDA